MAQDDAAIITASFVKLQTMADGTPRLIFDLDCDLSQIAAFDLRPGATFALARITDVAAKESAIQETLKGGPLSKEAAGLCKREDFQRFAAAQDVGGARFNATENGAATYIRTRCCVQSRAEIDHDEYADSVFHNIKSEFAKWNWR